MPITNFAKSSRGLVRTLEIFRSTHRPILGALRGRLFDSSAVLFVMYSCCCLIGLGLGLGLNILVLFPSLTDRRTDGQTDDMQSHS